MGPAQDPARCPLPLRCRFGYAADFPRYLAYTALGSKYASTLLDIYATCALVRPKVWAGCRLQAAGCWVPLQLQQPAFSVPRRAAADARLSCQLPMAPGLSYQRRRSRR